MKKYLIIFFLLFPLYNFAQKFEFNFLTNYKSENGFYKERTIFSNKDNDNYFLEIKKLKNSKKAYLEDLKNSYIHQFKVLEKSTDNNEPSYQFIYKKSTKVSHRNIPTTHKFKILKRDSISKIIELVTYKDKKIISIAELVIEDAPFNLFSLFRYSFLHPYEEYMELKFNENGIVKSYKNSDTDRPVYIFLDYYMDISNFELEVK